MMDDDHDEICSYCDGRCYNKPPVCEHCGGTERIVNNAGDACIPCEACTGLLLRN